jgi:hypothetical protein
MTCRPEGMFECVDIDEDIKVGDGKYIKATKVGHKQVTVHQPNGKREMSLICGSICSASLPVYIMDGPFPTKVL